MITLLLLAGSVLISGGRPGNRIGDTATTGGLLARARSTMTLFILTLGLGGLLFLLLGQFSVAVAGGVAATTAVATIREMQAGANRRRRSAATAAFLGHLLGELRAGSGMPQAMAAAAEAAEGQTPARFQEILQVTAARALAGGSGAAVLLDAQASVPELSDTAQLWRTAEHHGIPMAPLIEQAQARIDARDRHRAATTASLQGPQATAVVLTLLPVAGVLMGTAMGANPLGLLLGGGLGGILLVVGVSLSCGGFYWSRRIITGAQ